MGWRPGMGLAGLMVCMTGATFAVVNWHGTVRHAAAPAGAAPLHVFGAPGGAAARTGCACKFDAALAELAARSYELRPGRELRDLHAMNPAARFGLSARDGGPLVLIDAATRGDARTLLAALQALGLEHGSAFANAVSGWLPLAQLEAAAALGEVQVLSAALPRTRAGAVTTQGDFAQRSDVARSTLKLDGTGVTVGVISDSYDCYSKYAQPGSGVPASGANGYASNGFTATAADDVASGDLPSGVLVLSEANCLAYGAPLQLPFGDEGRAMMQILHDVAPGANFAFFTAENGSASFANGVLKLAASKGSGGAGAKIIAEDVGYFDEPFYQDGIVAQAIDTVKAQGVAYFTAAGNNGHLAYENTTPSFATLSQTAPTAGEHLLNFDRSGQTTTTSLPVTIPALIPGEFVAIVVQWDQPFVTGAPTSGGATSSIDLCVAGAGADQILNAYTMQPMGCTGASTVGGDPVRILLVGNPADASANTAQENITITVGLAGGTAPPGRVIVAVEDDGAGSQITAFATDSATIQGHSSAAGAAAVGAAFYYQTPECGTTPAVIEPFSSRGGAPILFDAGGNRLPAPQVRQKPDFVAPNGGNDTFLGFTLASAGFTGGQLPTTIAACQNVASYPNFFGTSAATPHAAGIAALMLQSNPTLTPDQIFGALTQSALTMNGGLPSFDSGVGFVQADAALKLIPAAPSSSGGGGGGGGAFGEDLLAALGLLVLARARRRGRPEVRAGRAVPRAAPPPLGPAPGRAPPPRRMTVSPSSRKARVSADPRRIGSRPPWVSSSSEPASSAAGPDWVPVPSRSPARRLQPFTV